jgi:hypothetical protein
MMIVPEQQLVLFVTIVRTMSVTGQLSGTPAAAVAQQQQQQHLLETTDSLSLKDMELEQSTSVQLVSGAAGATAAQKTVFGKVIGNSIDKKKKRSGWLSEYVIT